MTNKCAMFGPLYFEWKYLTDFAFSEIINAMPSFAIIAIYGIILERASCDTSFHESLTSTGTGGL